MTKEKRDKEIEKILGKERYKKIKKEIDHLHKTKTPRCVVCGAPMINDIDSISKEVSPHNWKTTCGHAKNLRMSVG